MHLATPSPARQKQNERLVEDVRRYYATGNEALLNPVLATAGPALQRFLRFKGVFNRELVEDLVQDSLVDILLLLRKQRFRLVGNFMTWANDVCWKIFRKHYITKTNHLTQPSADEEPFRAFAGEASTSHWGADDFEAERRATGCLQALTEALQGLDEPDRAALEAFYYQGLTAHQACAHLGLSFAEFMKRFLRGRAQLSAWARQRPQLAPSGAEWAVLRHIDTGTLFSEEARFQREAGRNWGRSEASKERMRIHGREMRRKKAEAKAEARKQPSNEYSEHWALAA